MIKKIIYNEIGEHSGTLFVANQIIERMLHDEVLNRKYRSLSECVNYLRNSNKDYMYSLLDAYLHIDTQTTQQELPSFILLIYT